MHLALAPLVAFALSAAAPADREGAPADVAEALADADQILRVHEAPGAIVFDLDRAGELFQLTVRVDDDGRVTASDIDWAGPTAGATGIVVPSLVDVLAVLRIDVDPSGLVVLHDDEDRTLALALRVPR
jgi:hypothetical protein